MMFFGMNLLELSCWTWNDNWNAVWVWDGMWVVWLTVIFWGEWFSMLRMRLVLMVVLLSVAVVGSNWCRVLFWLTLLIVVVVGANWCGVLCWLALLNVVVVGANWCGMLSHLELAFGCVFSGWGRVFSRAWSDRGSLLPLMMALGLLVVI